MRLMVWLGLALIVFLAIRSKARSFRQNLHDAANKNFQSDPVFVRPDQSSVPAENMVACAYCQIYLPCSEALKLVVANSEHFFCNEEHLKTYSAGQVPLKSPDSE